MTESVEKILFSGSNPCPHCGKSINVKVVRETLVKPEKGSYKKFLSIEKEAQQSLEGLGKEEAEELADSLNQHEE